MSSSRSIAAARSRRAGESQPPVSGGRPVTSIASHSAFVPQQQMPPQPPNNVRVAKAPMQQQQQQQQQQMSQQGASPFSKLSISDAIGLVTLRLGRVEQFIIDFENGEIEGHHPNSGGSNIPENSRVVDNSVLTTIINRLDAIEKREGSNSNVTSLEKELKDTKDLLSHLLFKFELFTKETGEKFADFDGAISEIEKGMEAHQFVDINETVVVEEQILAPSPLAAAPSQEINTLDLKSIIKQEFSATDSN
jgi:hypothetical protein